MVSATCFVPGCKTGYKTNRKICKDEGKKCKTLFSAPKDPDLFEKWKKVIPRKDKELTKGCAVCELHFLPEDIERWFVTKLADGTINKIKRGKTVLRNGAIPYIFPMLPGYLSKCIPKRKLADKKSTARSKASRKTNSEVGVSIKEETDIDGEEGISPIKTNILLTSFQNNINDESLTTFNQLNLTGMHSLEGNAPDNSFFVLENLENNRNVELSITYCDFDFKCLIENLNMIEKPSHWWTITSFVESVICAKWNADYETERRVVIEQDLNVKVFLKDSKVDVSSGKKIESLIDVSLLLNEVDNLFLCAGIQQDENKSKKKCLLYFKRFAANFESNLCIECRRAQAVIPESQKQSQRNYELYDKIRNERRKNARLSRKVTRLTEEVNFLKKINRDIDSKAFK